VDPSTVFDAERWATELSDEARELLEQMYEEIGGDVSTRLGTRFDLTDHRVRAALETRVRRFAGTNDTTSRMIRQAIIEGEAAGESIDQIAARIRRVYSHATNVRAHMIARTEVVGATNEAGLIAAMQSEVVARKTWLSTLDDRTRRQPDDDFDHVVMDGVTVNLDEPFNVQGDLLQHPGDPAGQAGNVLQCRCALSLIRDVL
jgi:uncharacterized protein with gpF-like domain